MPLAAKTSSRDRDPTAPRFSGLSSRLILAVVVFAVVMAGAYYMLVHRPLHDRLRVDDETEVRLLFENVRNQLRLDFESAMAELSAVAGLARVRGFRKQDLDLVLEHQELTTTFFKKFTVLDMAGRVVSRPSFPSSIHVDRSTRGYFKGPLAHDRLFVDEVRPFGDGLSVSIGIPIVGLDGRNRGVLAGHVELTGRAPRLCKTTTGWPDGSRHQAILLSPKGIKVAQSTGLLEARTVAEVDTRDHPLYPLADYESVARVYSVDGVEYYGIVSKVLPFDWILILQEERGPMIASVESAIGGMALVLGIVFLALLAGVVIYASGTIRPIARLTSSLIRFGKVGSAQPLDSESVVGEVGDAIEAFNHMVVERSLADSELRRQSSELQALAHEMSRVEQRTRHDVASELHDHISQHMAATKIRLELLRGRQTSPKREESLRVAIELLGECLTSAARMTTRLTQPAIQQLGLVKALEALIAAYDAQHDVRFVFESDLSDLVVAAEFADVIYRGVTELLHNIIKHARASRGVLRLRVERERLHIEVEDDGVGFSAEPQPPRDDQIGGFGLFSFRERIRQFGGSLSIGSALQRGFLVTVIAPMRANNAVSREEVESR
jgi:signal transduction histidine kinase